MDLRSYVGVVKKYLPLFAVIGLLGLAIGWVYNVMTPRQYTADVQFYVSTPVEEGTNALSGSQFATERMTSYARLLTSPDLGDKIAQAAGIGLDGKTISEKITANTTVGSIVLQAVVTDTDADRALKIAQGIDKTFGPEVNALDNTGRKTPLVEIKTISTPKGSAEPVSPVLKNNLLLGLAVGVGLALMAALLLEMRGSMVRNSEDVSSYADALVIGTIPNDPTARSGRLLDSTQQASQRATAHRQVRSNLAFFEAPHPSKVLAFTSPVPGGGSTTVAANSALAFADAGERVCLIEADFRHPGLPALFGAESTEGLATLLAGRCSLNEAVRPWPDAPTLDLIYSGELPTDPNEMLGSPRYAQLIAELRKRYDRIIIDTPPVLPFSDALRSAVHADGVILVVRSGRTSAEQVEGAQTVLANNGVTLLGVVLNGTRPVENPRHRA